jgi:hypothetical protein
MRARVHDLPGEAETVTVEHHPARPARNRLVLLVPRVRGPVRRRRWGTGGGAVGPVPHDAVPRVARVQPQLRGAGPERAVRRRRHRFEGGERGE